ncbi:hypothetical protein Tco_1159895 [Tanacetum coccineum]
MDTANSLLSSFASKVKNIDGRVLAKDGKPIEDTTSKSMVKIVELSNDEIVKGDDVAIPLAAIDWLNTYAWALIDVSSKKALVDSLVVAIPFQNGSGHSMETIDIEYE